MCVDVYKRERVRVRAHGRECRGERQRLIRGELWESFIARIKQCLAMYYSRYIVSLTPKNADSHINQGVRSVKITNRCALNQLV
ncbi:hypothetical protein EVAR_96038_1 [Eumeta japonica]|uniref:Uncharacterized protein n=1 Tax=Eumeta variegata TaxID=151549 RepID=A0A4C1W7U7_EUMVA|nr:hypothetical protein EVAR_96038_1 [Eumeta japonica]